MVKAAKPNYAAWDINAQAFSADWPAIDKLTFFARYALLAPSGHNTQPWQFTRDDQSLLLKIRPGAELPHSGKLAAEPHISLGACLETLKLAASGFGYGLHIEYRLTDSVVAAITLGAAAKADPSLLTAITARTSNRHPFDHAALDTGVLKRIIQNPPAGTSACVITGREDIGFVAEQSRLATRALMGEPAFREELSHWVRNNLTRQHDGMPGFVQGMPTPPSLIAKHIIKRIDISKTQAKVDGQRIIDSAALVLILQDNTDPKSNLDAGRLYARICILAQQHGIASSGIAAAVLDPATCREVAKRFQLTQQPLALIRLGITSKAAPHTPRRPLAGVLV